MARTERIVVVIGCGGAGKRFAEAARLALMAAERELIRQQLKEAKELEAFKTYYNLNDEYVDKMKEVSAQLGITMTEVMHRLEQAGAVVREAARIIGTAFQEIAPVLEEIADLYREALRDSNKERPYTKKPPRGEIRPYRIEDKSFDKRNPYMYRNYRRRNK